MLRKATLNITLLIAAVCLPAGTAAVAAAQTGITVTPTTVAVTIAAGDETRERISLTNSSAAEIRVETRVEEPAAGETAAAITPTLEQVTLQPGETVQLELRMHVPDLAPPGDQRGNITFEAAGVDAQQHRRG